MSLNFTAPFLIRRLFWYIAFCVVLGPLILVPFTMGDSLLWYLFYFSNPFSELGLYIPVAVGIGLWVCRVFIGLFIRYWIRDHLVRAETGSIIPRRF